jgi:uncharacterized protein
MKVVFDTNVLISSFLFGGISAEVYDYCFIYHEIYISNWIIDELTEKFVNKFKISDLLLDKIREKLDEGCNIVNPEGEIPDICRDIDDNNILHLGMYTKSNYIITGDSDLLDLKEINGIKILNPRGFWMNKPKF